MTREPEHPRRRRALGIGGHPYNLLDTKPATAPYNPPRQPPARREGWRQPEGPRHPLAERLERLAKENPGAEVLAEIARRLRDDLVF
jgi:hypothetical protein